jgi:hypothetical protein
MLHMLQWNLPAAAARLACMHVGAEGARAVVAGNKVGTNQDVAPGGRVQAREMEQCGKRSGAGLHMKQAQACWYAQQHAYTRARRRRPTSGP